MSCSVADSRYSVVYRRSVNFTQDVSVLYNWALTGYWCHPDATVDVVYEHTTDDSIVISISALDGPVQATFFIDRSSYLPRRFEIGLGPKDEKLEFLEFQSTIVGLLPKRHTSFEDDEMISKTAVLDVSFEATSEQRFTMPAGRKISTYDNQRSPFVPVTIGRWKRMLVPVMINDIDVGVFLLDTGGQHNNDLSIESGRAWPRTPEYIAK